MSIRTDWQQAPFVTYTVTSQPEEYTDEHGISNDGFGVIFEGGSVFVIEGEPDELERLFEDILTEIRARDGR